MTYPLDLLSNERTFKTKKELKGKSLNNGLSLRIEVSLKERVNLEQRNKALFAFNWPGVSVPRFPDRNSFSS